MTNTFARHRARPFLCKVNGGDIPELTEPLSHDRYAPCAMQQSSGLKDEKMGRKKLTNQIGSIIFSVNHNGDSRMAAFTVRLSDETAAKLDHLAVKVDRSRSYVAAQAIEDYIAREEWQLAEIEAGLAEANRGEFASEKALADVVAKYVKPSLGR